MGEFFAALFSTRAGWVGQGSGAGKIRGSSLLERYIDLNDSRLPGLYTNNAQDSALDIDQYDKMRVVGKKSFAP